MAPRLSQVRTAVASSVRRSANQVSLSVLLSLPPVRRQQAEQSLLRNQRAYPARSDGRLAERSCTSSSPQSCSTSHSVLIAIVQPPWLCSRLSPTWPTTGHQRPLLSQGVIDSLV